MKKITKKFISLLLSLSLVMGVMPTAFGADTVFGDINEDGDINSMDAVLMMKCIAGYSDLEINRDACDVAFDGKIDAMDAVKLLKYIAGYDVVLGDVTVEEQEFEPISLTANRVSVHDPSIIKDTETDTYYVFGSHMAWAKSKDLVNWEVFTNNINSDYKTIFAEGAQWSANGGTQGSTTGAYDVFGNLWAPDVIYNEAMGKWCMYMSVNGDKWYSSIALLTADSLDGDWTYVDTVVYSGFTNTTQAAQTDFYDVYSGTDFPSRYTENRNGNRTYGTNCIDPCVFYDEDGTLWMSYGSWFGGIYMIELDPDTGLRDMTHTYETVTDESDEYQGIKIAGGNHVSGEASYIEYIDGYYYLFMSYGGLVANGGYNMRVFRSESAEGPYVDLSGNDARYLSNNTSAGDINGKVGIKLMTHYQWSHMAVGQVAQGHNSAFVDEDGKAYVVYHTRTNDGTEGHTVKVHQLFTSENGWLLAGPHEYRGEEISETGYEMEEMVGTYEVLYHKQSISYSTLECVLPQAIILNEDGTVTGDYTGTWETVANSPYVNMTLNGVGYKGVFVEQAVEETDYTTLSFTMVGDNEVEVWGSKYLDPVEAVALTIENNIVTVPGLAIDDLEFVAKGLYGTTVTYSSSDEDVITSEGVVTKSDEEQVVTITATFKNGDYTYEKAYEVTVPADNGGETLIAEYFTDGTSHNLGTVLVLDNPFNKNVTAGIDVYNGIAFEFDVVGTGSYLSNILSFMAADGNGGRMYFTGGSYLGYNATGGFFDANVDNGGSDDIWNPGNDYINGSATVKVVIKDTGYEVYFNDELKYTDDDVTAGTIQGANSVTGYINVLKWLNETADSFKLGTGSWWTDIFNGTISNIRFYAYEGEEVDTSGYEYYDDFNEGDITGWTSANAQSDLITESDGSSLRSFFTFKTDTSVSRNPSAYKVLDTAITGDITLEFDTKLTAGEVANRSQSAVIFGSSDLTGYSSNAIAGGGYILKLANNYSTSGSATTWVVNDTDEVTIAKNTWIHVKAVVDSANKEANVTITNVSTGAEIYTGTVPTSGESDFKIMQLVRGRGYGTISLDNITVVKK